MCVCWFDGSLDLAAVDQDDYTNPSPREPLYIYPGIGEIDSSTGDSAMHCYRNDVSLLCLEKTFCCEIYSSPSCDLTIILYYAQ